MRNYTVSGDAEHFYVSDSTGHIVETCDSLTDAQQSADYYNSTQVCSSCGGSGRGHGPDVKKESPVARGMFIWTPPRCLSCDGAGRIGAAVGQTPDGRHVSRGEDRRNRGDGRTRAVSNDSGLDTAPSVSTQSRLELTPTTLADAKAFVAEVHRHHGPPVGHRFSVGCKDDGHRCAVCGSPTCDPMEHH